jgi:hypothetical protein
LFGCTVVTDERRHQFSAHAAVPGVLNVDAMAEHMSKFRFHKFRFHKFRFH